MIWATIVVPVCILNMIEIDGTADQPDLLMPIPPTWLIRQTSLAYKFRHLVA